MAGFPQVGKIYPGRTRIIYPEKGPDNVFNQGVSTTIAGVSPLKTVARDKIESPVPILRASTERTVKLNPALSSVPALIAGGYTVVS